MCLRVVWTGPGEPIMHDDFAGHWAHNANLSVKAIMGVAGYSEMAHMLGLYDVAEKYAGIAKKMAVKWGNGK
ncbi:glutaminase A [Bacteroides thetaiotaomicron]|nr:glutaminase A [Bacteroides thetaiotaomicron]